MVRRHAHIQGVVQGVGFRPFVHHLAEEYNLCGWVLNSSEGVHLEVEGDAARVEGFLTDLVGLAPPLAQIDRVRVESRPVLGEPGFAIRKSAAQEREFVLVSPDVATCADCLRELLDPSDRRFCYPFINCTNCGPRYSIIQDLPYDRPMTTMSVFPMCPECEAEYRDPQNRRYHAQPNACPRCGPHVWLEMLRTERPEASGRGRASGASSARHSSGPTSCAFGAFGRPLRQTVDPIAQAARLLDNGAIVAIKGLGGFHLACSAEDQAAVLRLRRRKGREEKPLAIMAASAERVREFCLLSPAVQAILKSRQRPILLLEKRAGADELIAPAVAPGNRYLGVMLPYTPLHHLLLREVRCRALVMTSANFAEEPLCKDNEEAKSRLAGVADAFLLHNRDIHVRSDDSVARVFDQRSAIVGAGLRPRPQQSATTDQRSTMDDGRLLMARRARGYAPLPVRIDFELEEILACGAELKSTLCYARGNYLFLSQHIGDLENLETFDYYREIARHLEALFRVEPRAVAHDLHPDYLSTRFAHEEAARLEEIHHRPVPTIPVQHHHAHVVSTMAEHGLRGPVIGVAFDGMGLGPDGRVWGGEFLVATLSSYERVAHLRPVPLPGGDQAAREPWRMAAVHLREAFGDDFLHLPIDFVDRLRKPEWRVLERMMEAGINSPFTSSVGRLFDAVAALVGLRDRILFEGQAAMELEMAADPAEAGSYPAVLSHEGGTILIDPRPMVEVMVADLRNGPAVGSVAARFHRWLAASVGEVCDAIRAETGIDQVCVGGGCFQNMLLLRWVLEDLSARGFEVHHPQRLPSNDGGLAVGQAVVAHARLAADGRDSEFGIRNWETEHSEPKIPNPKLRIPSGGGGGDLVPGHAHAG